MALTLFTLQDFIQFNEAELQAIFSETGRTLELDFELELEEEYIYDNKAKYELQYKGLIWLGDLDIKA